MIQFEALLSGELSQPPDELLKQLNSYAKLQRNIRQLTIYDAYALLRAELVMQNRPSVLRRLERRLSGLLAEQLQNHFIALRASTQGEEDD